MIAQFKNRRGYDPLPWMPVLAGRVVESSEASDGFLWDFRKTIADLIADEHYGQVQASLKERGMGHYGESHEGGRAFVADGMEVKKLDDSPDERDVDAGSRERTRRATTTTRTTGNRRPWRTSTARTSPRPSR